MKITVKIPHVTWRNGRPRFNPGPKVRALGYGGEDLRHRSGAWFDLREAEDWARARCEEIAARKTRKAAGRRVTETARPRGYCLDNLFDDLFDSRQFAQLASATQRDYRLKAGAFFTFEPALRDVAAADLAPADIHALHEALWKAKGLHMANGMLAVLRRAYSVAVLRGKGALAGNPCLKMEVETPAPRLRVASPAEIAALMAAADALEPSVGDAILLALFSGQRQGDVLALREEGTEGGRIRLRQRKTGAVVSVFALPPLVARLAQIRERNREAGRLSPVVVLHPRTGKAWDANTFRHVYAGIRDEAAKEMASLGDFRFQDLRDTSVTWLHRSGCDIPEIRSVTGHSDKTVYTILKHYLALDEATNDRAMTKLGAYLDREGVKL
jgi:integrase